MEKESIQAWYDQNRSRYADLVETLERLIKTLLAEKKIPYHSVNGRVKDRDSYTEKFTRKGYSSLEQVMDLAGLRIITHTTKEVKCVCELIEGEFEVDPENSGNKAKDMGIDKVGYLSVHYVVTFRANRLQFPEYARFDGLRCEIQVRSLLQHAWAEIEHDRNYKFTGVLPEEMQRRFYLVAGTLELMDQEFFALSQEIDQYAERVKAEAEQGSLENISIDSTSLLQFLNEFFKDFNPEELGENYPRGNSVMIDELSACGIENLQQLNTLLCQKTAAEWVINKNNHFIGILRDAMILKDPEKYFTKAWKQHWTAMGSYDLEFWEKLGVDMQSVKKCVNITPLEGGDYQITPVLTPSENAS